ncbi:hypothetical protein [uncultured Rhodoblastus sp.]|uniref:hypothetical protein n=1 Tax=uncultured Rhodoblastus sp. TaxID=543037 RepID=UPI0025D84C01|nr:hypothetical protein [uncultured Rhodoblastus sp.]
MRPKKFFAPALALTLLAAHAPIRAEEKAGCAGFKWPIERAQAALAAPDRKTIAADGALAAGPAVIVRLAPVETVPFKVAPDRAPAPNTFGAVLKFAAPSAGVYTVNLSAGAWIDAVQDGVALKPLAFSGAPDCPHIHKSLKYQLAPGETFIQISNAPEAEISIVVQVE